MKPSRVSVEALRMMSPVGITAGLATLFFGLSHGPKQPVWFDIIAGIILVGLGLTGFRKYTNYIASLDKQAESESTTTAKEITLAITQQLPPIPVKGNLESQLSKRGKAVAEVYQTIYQGIQNAHEQKSQ